MSIKCSSSKCQLRESKFGDQTNKILFITAIASANLSLEKRVASSSKVTSR